MLRRKWPRFSSDNSAGTDRNVRVTPGDSEPIDDLISVVVVEGKGRRGPRWLYLAEIRPEQPSYVELMLCLGASVFAGHGGIRVEVGFNGADQLVDDATTEIKLLQFLLKFSN